MFYFTNSTNIEGHLGSLHYSPWWLTVQGWSELTAGARPKTKSWKSNYAKNRNYSYYINYVDILELIRLSLRADSKRTHWLILILKFGYGCWNWVWIKQPEPEQTNKSGLQLLDVALLLCDFQSGPRKVSQGRLQGSPAKQWIVFFFHFFLLEITERHTL